MLMQKLYCYADEAGQDASSRFFIVVTVVVSQQDQDELKTQLGMIEQRAGTNHKKWHKVRHANRMRYLTLLLERRTATGNVYAAHYPKPIPYFFPFIKVIERAVKGSAQGSYRAQVYVDGIDAKKARELTNALRANGVVLRFVKSRRDESEPLIRLADMWAGCMRSALLGHEDTRAMVERAKRENYLCDLTT